MALKINIPDAFEQNNIKTLAKGFGTPLVKRALLNKIQAEEEDRPEGTSRFGTPIYGSLYIRKPVYSVYEYNENDPVNPYEALPTAVILADNKSYAENDNGCFIESVIIDCNTPKNVITTVISGAPGSVKEYINAADKALTIRGYFANKEPNKYPYLDMKVLKSYCEAPVSLEIVNDYLNNVCAISNIVVLNIYEFQQPGVRNIQFFEISAISDVDYQIIEKTK